MRLDGYKYLITSLIYSSLASLTTISPPSHLPLTLNGMEWNGMEWKGSAPPPSHHHLTISILRISRRFGSLGFKAGRGAKR
jgi:hypothetical protein